jgi:hypothetical protein
MSKPISEKITVTVTPELYHLLELESERRDVGIATLCRHLIVKSLKHSIVGELNLKDIIRLKGESEQEF